MAIGPYTGDDFLDLVKSFHGSVAPGILLGGYMVASLQRQLPRDRLHDALCETPACLPDAVQLLTPCTTGNGWLRVIDLGRYAVTLYDKENGQGMRAFVDTAKLAAYPAIEAWYYKRKSKKSQDKERLLAEMKSAGASVCSYQSVTVPARLRGKASRGAMKPCPICGEGYPARHGAICRGCQGEAPYENPPEREKAVCLSVPVVNTVALNHAVGLPLLHDLTQVEPGRSKGPVFRRGQVIEAGDICRLQRMGKRHLYVEESAPPEADWIHEDDAARAFAEAMAGKGVAYGGAPREGKITFTAREDGLLVVDSVLLEAFNMIEGVMCAARQSFAVVQSGRALAATRAIPLYLPIGQFARAMAVLSGGPLFSVKPMRRARAGILVTGTEVFEKRIVDGFAPIIRNKVERLDCQVVWQDIVPDERAAITDAVAAAQEAGVDLLVTTAGLSVDPDDVTRQGLLDAGAVNLRYGVPVLPGAMLLLAQIGTVQVIGVPACALYHKATSFDLVLPRLLADIDITRRDMARLAEGGFCLGCKTCTFPKCGFGK
jgi:formylmethanofuran dehydrogenase subunit E